MPLGQVFLKDKNILNKIVNHVKIQKDEWILEIGAGSGELTEAMLKNGARVLAVEVDPKLIKNLHAKFADAIRCEIIAKDYRQLDLKSQLDSLGVTEPIRVVSNPPYYLTTPILLKLIREKKYLTEIFLTLQKEVGERITARPRTPQYGSLTCLINYHFDVQYLFSISKNSFRPIPRVDSAFLHFQARSSPRVQSKDETLLFTVIRASFSKRRKKLRTVLRTLFPILDLTYLEDTSDISLDRRGEELTLEEFNKIALGIVAAKSLTKV